MKDRIRVLYVREQGSDRWDLWFAMSEASWEAGNKFPDPSGVTAETRELWININPDEVKAVLNTTDITGSPSV